MSVLRPHSHLLTRIGPDHDRYFGQGFVLDVRPSQVDLFIRCPDRFAERPPNAELFEAGWRLGLPVGRLMFAVYRALRSDAWTFRLAPVRVVLSAAGDVRTVRPEKSWRPLRGGLRARA